MPSNPIEPSPENMKVAEKLYLHDIAGMRRVVVVRNLALALDAATARAREWQPISTVPKDGTVVDLWMEVPAEYPEHREYLDERLPPSRWANCHFDVATQCWLSSIEQPILWMNSRRPAKWMPLPAPPAKSK